MTALTITYSRPNASRSMLGVSDAHAVGQAAAQGYVTLARRYER